MNKGRLWGLFVVLFLFASIIFGQGTTGTLTGTVADEKGEAIPGATVILTGPNLQGERGGITNAEGAFRIPQLPPGKDFQLSAEAEGYNKAILKGINISLGVTSSLSVKLTSGQTTVVIIAHTPVTELKSTKASTNLTSEELNSIPIGRSYQDAFMLAPGVQDQLGGNPSVGSASGVENTFSLEGLNITDPVTGTFGMNMNQNFIQEVQVITSGFDAETEASTGGLINAVSKSGSNEFKGEFYTYFTETSFAAKTVGTDFAVTRPKTSQYRDYDVGVDFGGPIIKDKLWFFVAYNPTFFSRHSVYAPDEIPWKEGSIDKYPDQALHTKGFRYDPKIKGDLWSTKLSFRLSNKHHFELSLLSDPVYFQTAEDTRNSYDWDYINKDTPLPLNTLPTYTGTRVNLKPAYITSRWQGGYTVSLKYNGTYTANLFAEVLIGRHHSRLDLAPAYEDGWKYPAIYDVSFYPAIKTTPGLGFFSYNDRDLDQGGFKVTYNLKKHEFKVGILLEKARDLSISGWPGDYAQIQYWDLSIVGGKEKWTSSWTRYLNPEDQSTDESGYYRVGFAQDKWSINDYMTFTYGFRWETQAVISETAYKPVFYGNSSMSPRWMKGEHLVLHSLAPRLGFTWDVAKNGKSKLYGYFGRFYQRLPIAFAIAMDVGHPTIIRTFTNGTPDGAPFFLGGVPSKTWGHIKGQYDDKRSFGFAYEIAPEFDLESRLEYNTLGRIIEDMSFDDANSYVMGNPGPNIIPMMPKPIRTYKALVIEAHKRLQEDWFLIANYTLSRGRGNFAGGYDPTVGQLFPNATMDYDLQYKPFYQNRYGYLPTDRTHQLKFMLGYKFKSGITASSYLNLESGLPINMVVDTSVIADEQKQKLGFGDQNPFLYGTEFLKPRGTAGRLPTTWTLDLHADYNFKVWGGQSMQVVADIFNVTNEQRPTSVNEYIDGYRSVKDPNTGEVLKVIPIMTHYGLVTGRQAPRYVRLGFKWNF